MAYVGAISYMDIPFERTTWSTNTFKNPFEADSPRQTKRMEEDGTSPELVAWAQGLKVEGIEFPKESRL